MDSDVGLDTDRVEAGSSGVGVDVDDGFSDEGVITCEVEAGSSGATAEVDDDSLTTGESVINACSLKVEMAVVVAGMVDV